MYTSVIGRRFLDRANTRDGRQRSPAEFFDEEFFPVVFGHDDYLMPAGNSKFGQLVNSRKQLQVTAEREGRVWGADEKARLRHGALADFHNAAAKTTQPYMHVVIGGYAEDVTKTTSGQVTAIEHWADADDVYLSWIGAAAGAGVAGGLALLIDHPDVFDAIRDGWALYRRFLSETPNLRANQLETWNGQWLRHRFSASYDPTNPTAFVHAPGVLNSKSPPYSIETVSWARLLLSLGRSLGTAPISAYVYSLGQMNSTVGFVPLHLSDTGVLRESYATLHDFYRSLFGEAIDAVPADHLDDVYDAGFGFAKACERGAIGLSVFEPAGLRDFLPTAKNKQPRPVSPAAAQSPLLHQTWIHAMLGTQKHELLDRAIETAEMLLEFESSSLGGKRNLKKSVMEALEANSLPSLITGLTKIAEDLQDTSRSRANDEDVSRTLETLDGLVRASLDLTPERFQLFLALLRFQVAVLRGKQQHAASL
jgi:hypothetical protein